MWRGFVPVAGAVSWPAPAAWSVAHDALLVMGEDQDGERPAWVWCELQPWSTRTVHLPALQPCTRPSPQLPDLGVMYQGQAAVNGHAVTWSAFGVDGPSWWLKGSVVVAPDVVVGLHFTHTPEQPFVMQCDVRILAMSPHEQPVVLGTPICATWGDAQVWVGNTAGCVLPSGFALQHNAPVIVPSTFVWARMFQRPDDADVARAQHARSASAVVW